MLLFFSLFLSDISIFTLFVLPVLQQALTSLLLHEERKLDRCVNIVFGVLRRLTFSHLHGRLCTSASHRLLAVYRCISSVYIYIYACLCVKVGVWQQWNIHRKGNPVLSFLSSFLFLILAHTFSPFLPHFCSFPFQHRVS